MSVLDIKVSYKGEELFTKEIKQEDEISNVEKYVEEVVDKDLAKELEINFSSNLDIDLQNQTVTFNLVYLPKQFLQDSEQICLSEYFDLEELAEDTDAEELVYAEMVDQIIKWAISKFNIRYTIK